MEKTATDLDSLGVSHLATRREIEAAATPCRDLGEPLLTFTDLLPHRECQLRVLAGELAGAPLAVGNPHSPQLFGVFHRNSAQPDRVDELEDGGVGADSQRESQNRYDGKPWTEAKQPQSVAKVLPE